MARYDRIGTTYARTRRPDPRIAGALERARGNAPSIVNVGAGAGSYEPPDRVVVAVEPSATMIRQRPAGAAPAVRARAELLPFGDHVFDAAMALFTVHHWRDLDAGMAELTRVARDRLVILTWDPSYTGDDWLTAQYFPAILDRDRVRFPRLERITAWLLEASVSVLDVPHDCEDGFLGAFWRRPEAYLDPSVRAGSSAFALMGEAALADGLGALEADLRSGRWRARNRHLLDQPTWDVGYRLIVGRPR